MIRPLPASPRAPLAPLLKPGRSDSVAGRSDMAQDIGGHPADIGASVGGDIVDEWGRQSFPASDPPANW
jgi:hypothetical protein